MSQSIRSIPSYVPRAEIFTVRRRHAVRPTTREWTRHATLFVLTLLTATWAGVSLLIPGDALAEPATFSPISPFDYAILIPNYYAQMLQGVAAYAFAHPFIIMQGALFAVALLTILLAHEAGHYIACRLYGVDATLPFFIPLPPPFMAGTLGAFIKIKSPIPSRRALFDIGVAGPLAGFVALIPVACVALLTAKAQTSTLARAATEGSAIIFNDPPLLRLLASALGVRDLAHIAPNPFYFAAWIGLLVTSLNLLPVGQLDGGHATYAVFGSRVHRRVGLIAFLSIVALAPLGWLWHGAPSGIVYAVLLFVMLRVRHPEAEDERDSLGNARTLVAVLTLLVFLLSFTPFPLTIT